MKIKNKIISISTALILAVSAIPAQATSISEKLSMSDDDIKICYNGDIIKSNVFSENIDGRIMIPFRSVLESMGAEVSYDNESKTVTALKGDTTISFILGDDEISVDKNGERSTVTMDVGMVVRDGNTLVPIRFLCDALGMDVSWDECWKTVLIVDTQKYEEEIENNCPNLMKLLEVGNFGFNIQNSNINVNLKVLENFFNLTSKANINLVILDGMTDVGSKFNLNLLYSNKLDLELTDVTFDIRTDGESIYLNTNAIDKLKEVNSDAKEIENILDNKAISQITADTWVKIDLSKVAEYIGIPESCVESIKQVLKSGKIENFSEFIVGMKENEGVVGNQALESRIVAYTSIDKYINVVEKEDGSKEISFKMTTEDMKDYIKAVMDAGESYGDDEYNKYRENTMSMILSMIVCDIDMTSIIKDNNAVSVGKIKLSLGGVVQIDMTVDGNCEKNEDVELKGIPKDSLDLFELINKK